MPLLLEYWKPVVGFEGLYEISCTGRVRGLTTGVILRQRISNRGYYQVELNKDAVRFHRLVHSLVAVAFIGNKPKGMEVNHKDSWAANNRVSNLEYVTPSENMKHFWRSEKALSRMTRRDIVLEIRRAYRIEGCREVARRLGMSHHTVLDIARGKRCARIT